jgi:creatinine amidohydrolase
MRRLASLAYPEAAALLQKGAIALWPIGSTEAHGPHLPLATDQIIAEATADRAGQLLEERIGLEALILPTLSLTVTEFAAPFAGTLSIPRESALAFVRDGALAAAKLGARAVCLINAHLEPAHRFMLRDAVKEARAKTAVPIALADPADRRFAGTLTEEFSKGACHAGQYESSLVLAARPDLVNTEAMSRLSSKEIDLLERIKAGARNFVEAGAPDAYFGTPARASKDEGEQTYRRLAEIVCTVIEEAIAEGAKKT